VSSAPFGSHQITFEVDALSTLAGEAGGHRVQRIPPTEKRGRVHTSTVTVSVVAQDERQSSFSERDISVEWFSGSGKGGQHRNKHQNSCRLTHLPTGTTKSAQTRSRENSYRLALEALRREIEGLDSSQAVEGENAVRRAQVGSGMRADKRRTYRERDDKVVDHISGRRCTYSQAMRGEFNRLW